MNYLSEKPKLIQHYVIYCKGFNAKDMCYEFLRVEKSILTYHERPLIEGYDFKHNRSVWISLHLRDWVTDEPLPLFLVPANDVANCFERVSVKAYQFTINGSGTIKSDYK